MRTVKNRPLWAHALPFLAFMLFLAFDSVLTTVFQDSGMLWLAQPKYWIYPLQTLVCGGLVVWFWKEYDFGSVRAWPMGVLAGLVALVLWVSPQAFFEFPPRTGGFNPDLFASQPTIYWLNLIARFARMVIVVSLVEEIFWRGFVMRFLINEDFKKVPFGAYTPLSFFGVAILFTLEHGMSDWPAAILTGLIYNGLAVRSKSLWACIVAHGVTNFGLGLYTVATKQWGFW
jgi:uncharacterized protein